MNKSIFMRLDCDGDMPCRLVHDPDGTFLTRHALESQLRQSAVSLLNEICRDLPVAMMTADGEFLVSLSEIQRRAEAAIKRVHSGGGSHD